MSKLENEIVYSQTKKLILSDFIRVLKLSYNLSDSLAEEISTYSLLMPYSKLAALKLGNSISKTSARFQADWAAFNQGDESNPYVRAFSLAFNTASDVYHINTSSKMKKMLKAKTLD